MKYKQKLPDNRFVCVKFQNKIYRGNWNTLFDRSLIHQISVDTKINLSDVREVL